MAEAVSKPSLIYRLMRWTFWFLVAFLAGLLTLVVFKAALKLLLQPDATAFLATMVLYGIAEGLIMAVPVLLLALVAAGIWAIKRLARGTRLGIIYVLGIATFAGILWGYKAAAKFGVGYLSPYWGWFETKNTDQTSALHTLLIYLPDLVISLLGALVWTRIYTQRCLGAARG